MTSQAKCVGTLHESSTCQMSAGAQCACGYHPGAAQPLTETERATVERFEHAPDALVEDLRDEVAGVLAEHTWQGIPTLCRCGWDEAEVGRATGESHAEHAADALLPLIAQREAAARAEERERVARAITTSVHYGAELRHDGTEDPRMAAYVEGIGDAARIARGDA